VATHGQGRGDANPSLSIGSDAEGNVLLKCFAGCDTASIVEALDLKMGDLYEHHNGSRRGGPYIPSKSSSIHQPATLENYAAT
jgi:hypothetical protein